MDARLTGAIAENLAAWHELQLGALGDAGVRTGGWWLAPDPVPAIYLRAVALGPDADPAALLRGIGHDGWAAAADPFGTVALATDGWQPEPPRAWLHRPAGAGMPPEPPPGYTIDRVADAPTLAAFEIAAAAGFAVDPPAPGGWHASASLADPRGAAWIVRAGPAIVATAMAIRAGGLLGIYGVATLPGHRRRGIGTALVRHLLAQDPGLPAVLQPSPMAAGLYARLGFRPAGATRTWVRPPRP